MKAEDLMIGDWVMSNDLKTPIKICSIMNHYGTNIYFYHNAREYIASDFQLNPIPLTPEILEKNGFDGNDGYAIFRLEDDSELLYYFHEYKLTRYYKHEIIFRCQCVYAHELQHALKMCGIEKEISV